MKAIAKINATRKYLDYLEEHILNVSKAFEIVRDKCHDMRFIWDDFHYFNLEEDINHHDISKLSKEEFVQYRQFFFPTEDEKKEDAKLDFDLAWEHHKAKTLHHWENVMTEETGYPNSWENNCAHMVIDWMAMSMKFGDTARDYYEKNKDKIKLPDYAIKFIYDIFKRIE